MNGSARDRKAASGGELSLTGPDGSVAATSRERCDAHAPAGGSRLRPDHAMTRSGAPFHGAHGEGRSAISPAASQAGAEPCALAFPAARARRNAPVISDNAVVAVPMNWRAESTGNPLPLSTTQLAEIMAKVDRPADFGCAAALRPAYAARRS